MGTEQDRSEQSTVESDGHGHSFCGDTKSPRAAEPYQK